MMWVGMMWGEVRWVGMMWGGCGGICNIYDLLDKSVSV